MSKTEKTAKAAKKTEAKGEAKAAAAETFKYGVADIAKQLGVKEASARVQLRNHKVKKAGKSYGWNTKDELQAVVDKIRPAKEEKPAKKADKAAGKKSKKGGDDE